MSRVDFGGRGVGKEKGIVVKVECEWDGWAESMEWTVLGVRWGVDLTCKMQKR